MSNATEELLCKLLEERGIEWKDGDAAYEIEWSTPDGRRCSAMYWKPTFTVLISGCTPEQAIAATLGSGKLTADDVRDLIERYSYAAGGNGRDFHNGAYEAIADELNAALGGGECEYVIEDNMNESEGMGDVWFRCTNCDMKYEYYADDWLMKQNYCPHCGFEVRKAVKR